MHLEWILALLLTVAVGAELTAKDASEGPCNPHIEKHLTTNVNSAELARTKDYYVPMGSQAMYRHYAEVFLGRPLANETELFEMQLRIKFSLGTFAANRAFPHVENSLYFSQKCTANPDNIVGSVTSMTIQVVCKPICKSGSSSSNLNDPGIRSTLDSVVYTDNETTLLIVRCPSDGIQDYKVLSTNKTISEPSRSRILYKIKEIGFDIDKLYYMQYEA